MRPHGGPYWLLGLPFDAVDMDQAIEIIHAAARERSRLLFVTPNVNFVAMAARDPAFRHTVLHSQLSLVDGMPLVWLGRSAGIPFPERVAGSSLLDRLARSERSLRVYFFGGPPDAGRLACERLPSLGTGLVPVGYHTPGFGSIESMSTPELIGAINRSAADFLVVALGAKKGHEWIARNQDKLDVPVISHLGASINFLAGTIARAPKWIQSSGLEWIWRILEEPSLFRRYRDDGLFFLPATFAARHLRSSPASGSLQIEMEGAGNSRVWKLDGALTRTTADALFRAAAPATLDVSRLTQIDAAGFGALYALRYRQPRPATAIVCHSPVAMRLFQAHRAEALLDKP
jgi:N-acetylglucosaminyldiphosphoundecaprenol N-acetyl-beta-D-mannosaminyltransferase